jgi:dual specificity protein kinase YAK1
MQDAQDQYGSMKYPIRPHHQQHLSTGRAASHHSPQEPSVAAQRYSPMETLSPSSPYGAAPPQGQYGSQSGPQGQSPTRPGSYSSPNSYYANRQQAQQLAPITPFASNNEGYPSSATAQLNAVFGNDPKSPRRPAPQSAQGPAGRGPVPEFSKVRSMADLQPKVNAQPAFRRANPEGGFISVCIPQKVPKISANVQSSPFKLSRVISHPHIVSATQVLNTSHLETLAESLQNRARVSRMMGLIMRIVIIYFM